MALDYIQTRDMIREGTRFDNCLLCVQEESSIPGILSGKDIFSFRFNGLQYSMCFRHFKSLLGNYELISKDELKELRDVANSKTT